MHQTKQEIWWRENGGNKWYQEMERRKAKPHYKNQIILINKVFQEVCSLVNKPNILEFGCGYGRIIDHIQKSFRGVDVYGCDQSEKMLVEAELLGFPKEKLFEGNVRESFEDMPKFDITYTCEMLIHIAPEDIEEVIKNIISKTNKYVIHIENWPIPKGLKSLKSSDEHSGCWKHDYISIYERLGKEVEIRSQDYTEHTGYIIKVN
jgi:SAM-dependent methyltransferase